MGGTSIVNKDTVIKPEAKQYALVNDKSVKLDVIPSIKNYRIMVPLRFIVESLDCEIKYADSAININIDPLFINDIEINAVQYEYHMTMGGVIQQIKGNGYINSIYDVIKNNIGAETEAPESYSWMIHVDNQYYKAGQYDFLDLNGKSLQQYDIYTIYNYSSEAQKNNPKAAVIHDVTKGQWHLFNGQALASLHELVQQSTRNGFLEVISNTVV
jgi:hypothetical protein